MKERISILSDYKIVLKYLNIAREFRYIFEIKPSKTDSESGIVASIRQSIETSKSKIIEKQQRWHEKHNEKFSTLNNEQMSMKEDIQTIKECVRDISVHHKEDI